MEKLLSVAELAKKLNVTTQAIYKRLDKDLADFVVVKNNKTFIKESFLEEDDEAAKAASSTEQIESDNQLVSVLLSQLEIKDKQIEALNTNLENALLRLQESQHLIYKLQLNAPKGQAAAEEAEPIDDIVELVDETENEETEPLEGANEEPEEVVKEPEEDDPEERKNRKSLITFIKRLFR